MGSHFPFSNIYTFIFRMYATFLSYLSPSYTEYAHPSSWSRLLHFSFIWLLLYQNVQILPHPGHSSTWPSSLFIVAPAIDYKNVYHHILCHRGVTLQSQLLELVIMRKLMSLVFPICQHDIIRVGKMASRTSLICVSI